MATAFTGSVFCQKLKQQVAETPGRFRAVVGSSRRVKWKKCRPANSSAMLYGASKPAENACFYVDGQNAQFRGHWPQKAVSLVLAVTGI